MSRSDFDNRRSLGFFSTTPGVERLADVADHLAELEPSPKIVSFDVFDTLLWRCVDARQTRARARRAVGAWLAEHHDRSVDEAAIGAEQRAFSRQRQLEVRRDGGEWSFADWYRHLAGLLGVDAEALVARGLAAELEAELATTRPAPGAQQTLQTLRAHGLSCVATSDTQLGQPQLADLLHAHGLELDATYSSATLGRSKRGGGVFEILRERHGLDDAELVHVGDNVKSDYIRPLGRGCRALWLPRRFDSPPIRLGVRRRIDTSTRRRVQELWRALDASPPDSAASALYEFGFEQLAPVLTIHALWQWRLFDRHHIPDVLYIAREGQAFLKVYEQLADLLPHSPRRHYVHLSRRAVAMAHPDDLLFRAANITGKTTRASVDDFLSQFVLPAPVCQRLLATAGLQRQDEWEPVSRGELRASVATHAQELRQEQTRQRKLVADYITQTIGPDASSLGLVDSGWAGTIQDTLRDILPDLDRLVGAYLGVSASGRMPHPTSQKRGLLRDDYRDTPGATALERSAGVIRVWEILLANDEGHTLCLERAEDGSVCPTQDRPTPRTPREQRSLDQIRQGLLDGVAARREGVRVLTDIARDWPLEVFEIAASMGSRRFTCYPDADLADRLLELSFEDNLAGGAARSLGLTSLTDGVAWLPGIVARRRLRPLQWILDIGASCKARWM